MAGPRDPFGVPVQTTTLYAGQNVDLEGLSETTRNALLRYAQSGVTPTLDIISGYRDPARNARVGGASRSQHLSGNAADISLKGRSPQERDAIVNHFLSDPSVNGFGVYGDSIHIDTRQGPKAYWGPSYGAESFGTVAPDLLPKVKEWAGQAPAKPVKQGGQIAMAKKMTEADIDALLTPASSPAPATAAPAAASRMTGADIDALLSADNGRMGFATPDQRGGGDASLRDIRRASYAEEAVKAGTGDTFGQKLGSATMATVLGAGQMIPFYNDIVAATSTAMGKGQGNTLAERFRDNSDRISGIVSADRQLQPVASYGGSALGLLASLLVGNAQLQAARGLGESVAASAGLGGLTGAAFGASTGDTLRERASNAVSGGLVGAGVGAAAPVVVNALAGGINLAGKAAAPITNTFRAWRDPAGEAQTRVANAFAKDGVSPANALAGLQEGGAPAAVVDAGGETVRALARSAANNSPEARQIMSPVIDDRFASQGDRVVDVLRTLGGGNVARTLDDMREAAQMSNRVAYSKAYQDGADGVWNAQLEALTAAPAIRAAIRSVQRVGANKTVAQGMPPVRNAFEEAANGGLRLARRADGSTATPNIQFWDYVQRNLRGKAGEAARAGNKDLAADYTALRRQVLESIDEAVPAFKDARQGAARAFGAEDAYEAGQKFLTSKMANFDGQKAVGKMTRAESELFAEGFRDAMIAKVREVSDSRNMVTQSIFNSPAALERIQIAMGPKRAEQLRAALVVEDTMDAVRKAMGNSSTARQLVELGLAGGGGMYGALTGDWKNAGLAIGAAGASRGKAVVETNLSKEIGKLLMSGDAAALETLITRAAKEPKTLREIQSFGAKLSGLLGSSSTAGVRPSEGAFVPRVANQSGATAEDQQK